MDRKSAKKTIDEILFRYYGISGELERLGGENLNYRVDTPDGERYVLKIVDGDTAEESSQLEFILLEHARNAGFPIELPYIVKNYTGSIETGIKIRKSGLHKARVISFVDGDVLENRSDISRNLLVDTGKCLALFDKAMADFDHPDAHRGHQWELPQAGRHREKLQLIENPELRELVAWAFDLWQDVQGALPALPHQVIHGDANKENLLAEGDRISGLVDFGDSCYNPRICELAVCLSYLMTDREDPMAAAASVIAGYVAEVELLEEELAVLFPLVCGRLAVTICMATSRMAIAPENTNWFVSLEPAIQLLGRLRAIGSDPLANQ